MIISKRIWAVLPSPPRMNCRGEGEKRKNCGEAQPMLKPN